MAKKKSISEADLKAIYESLVDAIPDIEIKGAKSSYTSLNGNMFSFLADGKLALRLPADAREKVIARNEDAICIQHGHVMKAYVLVPESTIRNKAGLKKLFASSCEYAKSLKPKSTTRKIK